MQKTPKWFLDNVKAFATAVLLFLFFKSFLFEPFNIPSESMLPTLKIGDFLFVSKYSFGYGRYSFPLPIKALGDERIMEKQPKRGDIIVFRNEVTDVTYIKRLIGLPCDTIQVKDSIVYLNGVAVKREKAPDFIDEDGNAFHAFTETLPNGVSYTVLEKDDNNGALDNTPLYTVPADHYFMMGDNRDRSGDSRSDMLGMVHKRALIGRAERIMYSSDGNYNILQFWAFPFSLRIDRFLIDLRPFY